MCGGPAFISATHNFFYYVLFVDDYCTHMSWAYFLKHKFEVFLVFVAFYDMLQTQFHAKPQILRTDNGGEYVNSAITQFLSDNWMLHQTSCPDTPQQNGIAERKNRKLLEIT